MKKTIATILAVATVLACLCVGTFAAAATEGMCDVKALNASVTLTPLDASGQAVTATKVKIGQTDVDCYFGAVKIRVAYSAAESGKDYAIFVSDSSDAALTEANTTYLNQETAASGTATFDAYPSGFTAGSTYYIYMSSNADSGVKDISKVGSFQWYQSFQYGDVDSNGKVETKDLTRLAKYFADFEVEIHPVASDCDGNGKIETKDLTRLAKYFADFPVKLGPDN